MERIRMRYHHAEMLNNVALLSHPGWSEYIKEVMRRSTPISDAGMTFLTELSEKYDNWENIEVDWVEEADDWCDGCDGLNDNSECDHRYTFDDPTLSPEENRKLVDKTIKDKHPELESAGNLSEAHKITTGQQY